MRPCLPFYSNLWPAWALARSRVAGLYAEVKVWRCGGAGEELGREVRVALSYLHPVVSFSCQVDGFDSWDSATGGDPMGFKLAGESFDA